jgi:hypothetical protein
MPLELLIIVQMKIEMVGTLILFKIDQILLCIYLHKIIIEQHKLFIGVGIIARNTFIMNRNVKIILSQLVHVIILLVLIQS